LRRARGCQTIVPIDTKETSMTERRTFLMAAGATAACSVFASRAGAQSFPTRPITLYSPWAVGGTTDQVMRAFAESATKVLGQSVVVEARPGAGGILGAQTVAQAKPDGYTLTQMPISVFRLPHMQKVAFHPINDFSYILCLTGYTFGLVVQAESPIRNFKDLIAYAKANPEKFTYGSPGTGTTPHLVVEDFSARAGVKLTHVPFKGVSEGLQALIGGHVMGHSDSTGWAPQVDAGRLRLLVTYGSKRTKRWPQVPNLKEEGVDTFSDSPFGIAGPKGMDPAVVKVLHDAFRKTLEDPMVLRTLERYDQPVIYMDSEGYTKFARDTYQAEKATIERLGLAKTT
jgi:tripartite-type tricarboxylate transporter receptor subunit TctC